MEAGDSLGRRIALRLLPLLLAVIVAAAWFADVQENGPYVLRNLVPPLLVVALAGWALARNNGHFGGDLRLPLATLGFAIPALGLSIYLHYAYSVNLNGLFDGATQPAEVFRFLPIYTAGAGVIGAAIGWIVGKRA